MSPSFTPSFELLLKNYSEAVDVATHAGESDGVTRRFFDLYVTVDDVKEVLNIRGRVMSTELSVAVEHLVKVQESLVNAFFEFMVDAADAFDFPRGTLSQSNPDILKLSKSSLTLSKKDLVDYARATEPESNPEYYLVLLDESKADQQSAAALRDYVNLRDRILGNKEAVNMIEELSEAFLEANVKGAFSALCVPSGTGKTQLAFCLQKQYAVIYLNMSLSRGGDDTKHQNIYNNFIHYMDFLIRKIRLDHFSGQFDALESPIWICGFVDALVKLLMLNPTLRLPEDLARVSVEPYNNIGKSHALITPKSCSELQKSIHYFEAEWKRKIVFFIDEFTADMHRLPESTLAALRRSLMDSKGIVVAASTDSGAVNMLKAGAANLASFDESKSWVFLFTQLPRYVPDETLKHKVLSIQGNDGVKKLLSFCLSSRPRFVEAVVGEIENFVGKPQWWGSRDAVLDFVEKLR